jgi:hypothetical protein
MFFYVRTSSVVKALYYSGIVTLTMTAAEVPHVRELLKIERTPEDQKGVLQ